MLHKEIKPIHESVEYASALKMLFMFLRRFQLLIICLGRLEIERNTMIVRTADQANLRTLVEMQGHRRKQWKSRAETT